MSTTTIGADNPGEATPTMGHRPWYLDRSRADEFAAAIDDIHHTTRRPKHEVTAAAFAVAIDNRDAIEARLATQGGNE